MLSNSCIYIKYFWESLQKQFQKDILATITYTTQHRVDKTNDNDSPLFLWPTFYLFLNIIYVLREKKYVILTANLKK